ncbi:Helix-turn-helix type 11 domain protein [uncultured Desulfobacterium sp.]|uniref:Helix-turn-helix type 11 domain protein n=1 Tax=uncultured Desulfobacterium sp. TaxID=201089 RepID=A0A445N0P7_9BACT|nr:Helix-turn-helix type 11 domain protein [uncultured Desulfobacterium sp.]
MARGDQLARQWLIIQTLISSRTGKSAADLAVDLDCHPRTVYRDLEALQAAGFPIYNERIERKNLWSLLDTVKHQIPVPFTLTELMALCFSSDMLKVFKETVFYDSLESLFKKVKTTIPPDSLTYLKNVEQTLHVGLKPYKQYSNFKEIINRVTDAAVNKKSVDIVYFTQSRKKESRRRVDPYRIWFFNGTFYLIGFCHVRKEIRIFAMDRIKMMSRSDMSFKIPEDFELKDFMRPSFGVFQGETVKVKIRFSADIAGYIREKVWHESQKIYNQKDGSVIFEAEVAGTDEIRFWIMTWGSKAEVLEPEKLREEIRAEAEAMLLQYSRDVDQIKDRSPAGINSIDIEGRKPQTKL